MSLADDPIVEEVRRIRREHAERFQYDLRRIFEDLQRSQQARNRLTVSGEPKRTTGTAASEKADPSPRPR